MFLFILIPAVTLIGYAYIIWVDQLFYKNMMEKQIDFTTNEGKAVELI